MEDGAKAQPIGVQPISQNSAPPARLRELSMERQSAWIDALFAKLGRMYGTTFASLWAGIAAHEVKAEWQESLAPFTGPQIAWALDTLKRECDVAPTLPRFLRLCSQSPRPETQAALPAPKAATPKGVMEEIAKAIGGNDNSLHHRAGWAVKVLTRIGHGEIMPMICETNAIEALTNLEARHLAPAEYVAMNRGVWTRKRERATV